jgi:hypothetical protein
MFHKSAKLLLMIGLSPLLVFGACRGEQDADAPAPPAANVGSVAGVAAPDTTAAAIWAHMEAADYRQNWQLWPGKGELYAGVEPHGMLLTTYVNDAAFAALSAGSTALPNGSVIVKENFMPDSTFAAATTMFRAGGYNPDHQDWFFVKFDATGVMEVAGREPMCQSCHGSAPGGDYLYTELPR